jgi:hypothetical protein
MRAMITERIAWTQAAINQTFVETCQIFPHVILIANGIRFILSTKWKYEPVNHDIFTGLV